MTRPFRLTVMETRMSTDDDKESLTPYDHTKLSAINTCPTWGIVRYSLHKTMGGSGREMALEAGVAAHEAFAALNWWHEYHRMGIRHFTKDDDSNLIMREGIRLFKSDRLDTMLSSQKDSATNRTNLINFSLEALYTSGFFDDPNDRNRTVSNISEGIIAFADRYDPSKYELWIGEDMIGIECVFDIVISITWEGREGSYHKDVRLVGKMDALKRNVKQNRLEVHDYKTGYRLDNSWLAQWTLSHQFTGYCAAGGTFTNEDCNHAKVIGMQIPIGRHPMDGIREEDVPRNALKYEKWAEWLIHTVEIDETYKEYPLDAPRYTHSCNRYFRPCSMVPLCDAMDTEDQQFVLDSMSNDEWSPLHE